MPPVKRYLVLLAAAAAAFGQPVSVSLPALTANPGQTLSVDITAGTVTGRGIYAFDLSLGFDAQVLTVQDVQNGTLTAGWGPPTWQVQAGQLKVGMGGSDPLTGPGVLLRVRVKVNDAAATGQNTALSWMKFVWNEGSPAAAPADGSIRITQDTAVPVFTQALQAKNVTAHSAVITWQTDEPARCRVIRRQTGETEQTLDFNDFQTSRQVTLTGLRASTGCSARVQVWDKAGNGPAESATVSWTTETVKVSLGTVSGHPGTDAAVPLGVSDVTGQGITVLDLVFRMDPQKLSFSGLETYGSLTGGWPAPAVSAAGGVVHITLTGSYALGGAGLLGTLRFHILPGAAVNTDAALTWQSASLQNGLLPVNTLNGAVQIRDLQPPVITVQPEASLTDAFTARIVWETDEPASGGVSWGPVSEPQDLIRSAGMSRTHDFLLASLRAGTVYTFQAENTDAAGNGPALGALQQFQTPAWTGPVLTAGALTLSAGQSGQITVSCDAAGTAIYQALCVLETDPGLVVTGLVSLSPSAWQTDEHWSGRGLTAVRAHGDPRTGTVPLFRIGLTAQTDVKGDHRMQVRFRMAEVNGMPCGSVNGQVIVQGTQPEPALQWRTEPVIAFPQTGRARIRWVTSQPGTARITVRAGGAAVQQTETVQTGGFGEAVCDGLTPGRTLDFTVDFENANRTQTLAFKADGMTVPSAQTVLLSAGNQFPAPGQTFTWPLRTGDVTGLEVYSLDLEIAFDPALLTFVSASSANTLTAAWGAPVVSASNGNVRIAMGGTHPGHRRRVFASASR